MKPKVTIKTSEILERINTEFGKVAYQSATPFMGSGPFWDFCKKTIEDPMYMSCITFANDLGVPPVKSLMTIYDRKMEKAEDFKVTAQESQWVGALMGFIFKFVLKYTSQKERCSVKMHGVITATRFLEAPCYYEFEK